MSRILALLSGLTLCMSLQAGTVLFDNTFPFPDGADVVADNIGLFDSFSTATNSGLLSKTEFLLSGDNTSSGSLSVDLFADTGVPSVGPMIANLGTISDAQLSIVPAIITLTPASQVSLAANTRYWIGLSSTTSTAMWNWSFNVSGPGVAGEFLHNDLGTFPSSQGAYQMEVEVAPEPAALLLSGVALLTCSIALRRRASR